MVVGRYGFNAILLVSAACLAMDAVLTWPYWRH
jgi:hypothetical protein